MFDLIISTQNFIFLMLLAHNYEEKVKIGRKGR